MTRVNKDTKPIYYENAKEMDKPLSELMEELRMEIDKTRGKLHDMKRSYGWDDRIEPLAGGLTSLLMAMYVVMMEFKEYEDKQRARAKKK